MDYPAVRDLDYDPVANWTLGLADELLTAIYEKQKMWGCVCGSVSGNLKIVDYDLYKILDSKEKAIQWRKENISLLRSLDTLVTFTPRGGFHVWLRTRRPGLPTRAISRVVKAIPWDIDLVRGDGGMVDSPSLEDQGRRQLLVPGRHEDS